MQVVCNKWPNLQILMSVLATELTDNCHTVPVASPVPITRDMRKWSHMRIVFQT